MLCTSERPSFAGLSANIRICLQRHCGGIQFICSAATSVSDYPSAVSRHNSMDVVWCNAYVCRTKQGLSQSMPIHKQMGSICAMYRRHIHTSSTATQHKPHKLTNDKLHTTTKSCFTQIFLETTPHEHPSSCLGNLGRSSPNPPAGSCQVLQSSTSCVWVFSKSLGLVPDAVGLRWWGALSAFSSPLVHRHHIYYFLSIRSYCEDYWYITALEKRNSKWYQKESLLLFVLPGVFFFLSPFVPMRRAQVSCFCKKQFEKIKYWYNGTVNPNRSQKPCHFTLHTLMRHRLEDLYLNGFMGGKRVTLESSPSPCKAAGSPRR